MHEYPGAQKLKKSRKGSKRLVSLWDIAENTLFSDAYEVCTIHICKTNRFLSLRIVQQQLLQQ